MFVYLPTVFTLLLVPYIYFRSIRLFPFKASTKLICLGITLAVSQAMLITRFLSAHFADLHLVLMRFGGFVLGIMVIFATLLLCRDTLLILFYLIRKVLSKPMFRISKVLGSQKVNACIFFLALGLTSYGMYEGLKVPDVKNQAIYIENLPPELENFTIAQLTDLHIGSSFTHNWLDKVVDKTNALNPDITVVTGDLVDGSVENEGYEIFYFTGLKAKYGVYYSLGNHEYYSGLEEWLPYFESINLNFLINEHVEIKVGDATLTLAGLADKAHGQKYVDHIAPNITQALDGATADSIRVLLAHQPAPAPEYSKHDIDLQLSGHTHGGLMIPLMPIVAQANNGYVSGLYQVDDMQLYVSNGTGLWGYVPLRFGASSEITLITLKKK